MIGVWRVFYPAGLLGWVKVAHPQIDPADQRLWWVPRFIGAFFIVISLIFMLGIIFR
jgi:hypothetical protein